MADKWIKVEDAIRIVIVEGQKYVGFENQDADIKPVADVCGSIVVALNHAPTTDSWQVKHGRWRHYEGTLTCSVCHTEIYDDIMELLGDDVPRYCPNCGADMRGGENDN